MMIRRGFYFSKVIGMKREPKEPVPPVIRIVESWSREASNIARPQYKNAASFFDVDTRARKRSLERATLQSTYKA
jgi:hypothetical protein